MRGGTRVSHRLLDLYPTLYQLCSFDFDVLKEQLSAIAAKDVKSAKVRDLVDRINDVYTNLSDEDIVAARKSDGKFAHIRKARYVSFPTGFYTASGEQVRMQLHRSSGDAEKGIAFKCIGFSTALLPDAEDNPDLQQKIADGSRNSIQHAKWIRPMTRNVQAVNQVQSRVHEILTHSQIVMHELNELTEALASDPETKPVSLIERMREKLRALMQK